MMQRLLIAVVCLAAGAAACTEQPVSQDRTLEATTEETRNYLRLLSSRLARRPLNMDELASIEENGAAAVDPVVQGWLRDPAFADAARDMIEHLLKTSGRLGDIDYDLPGNLAAHLAKHELPYSMLLTAGFCVGADDSQIPCDTEAPYTAGVLTTRAYLDANQSRFNLRRASTLMRVFACQIYPLADRLEPRIEKRRLIPMFQALTPEEQTVEEVRSGFGNGLGCYTCHGQFAAHTQLFVKFDSSGLWRSYAHGLQNHVGELGRSIGRFFASHFDGLERSQDERGQIFGRDVANLSEAARVITADEGFVSCAARRSFEYSFDLDETISAQTDLRIYTDIAERLRNAGHADPTFADLFRAVVTDPSIARAVIDQR
jgi:hypothetical protein